MRIAVLNSHGTQIDDEGKISYYYVVSDGYDFSGNNATDVTTIENLDLMNRIGRLSYCDYRDSERDYYKFTLTENWTAITNNEKIIISRLFIPTIPQIESVIDSEVLDSWAEKIANDYFSSMSNHSERVRILSGGDEYIQSKRSDALNGHLSMTSISATTIYSSGMTINEIIQDSLIGISGGTMLPVHHTDNVSSNVSYVGFGTTGATSIMKVITNNGSYDTLWAEGNKNRDKNWDNRYNYSYLAIN